MPADNKQPAPLEYATPAPAGIAEALRGPTAVLFGVLSGLFGAFMLYFGIPGIGYLIQEWDTRVDGGDVVGVTMFNLIGLFCCAVALRWIRSAFRRHGGTAGR